METTRNRGDETLLRNWAAAGSEAAFNELVRRHVGLVYRICLAELRGSSLAEDAVQAVFLALAQKKRTAADSGSLVGWLFLTSRLICKDILKAEARRRRREQAAGESTKSERQGDHAERLANALLLNDALAALRETDREAVLLRFYDQRSFQEVGEALGISDDTAQKCVSRALEKMRRRLIRSGVTLTVASLSAFLLAKSAPSVSPALLGKALLTATAIPGGQIAAALVGTKAYQISQGVMHAMRLKMIAATSAAAVLVACGILLASQIHEGPLLTMEKVRSHYTGVKSFSMTLVNYDGSFDDRSTQKLEWRSDGKFTLKTISGRNANTPNYYSDGRQVIAAYPGGMRQVEKPSSWNHYTGWEASGGNILSWLENTPSGNYALFGVPGGHLTWTYGPRTKWHGYHVREMIMHMDSVDDGGSGPATQSLFIDPATNEFIGYEWTTNGTPGYELYEDQKLTR